jgi:uncharacterized protein YjiS (DUF1127 family)
MAMRSESGAKARRHLTTFRRIWKRWCDIGRSVRGLTMISRRIVHPVSDIAVPRAFRYTLARDHPAPAPSSNTKTVLLNEDRFCAFCFARLTNGSDFCDTACADGPDDQRRDLEEPEDEEPLFHPEFGREAAWRALDAPPSPRECASVLDQEYIASTKLRQRLIEANP